MRRVRTGERCHGENSDDVLHGVVCLPVPH